METTMRTGLQERQSASLALPSSGESLNPMISDEPDKGDAKSMPCSLLLSGCNSEDRASMSGRVFVLDKEGKPITPCKVSKARKLLEGRQAVPVWNKLGMFGLQMLVDTRKETPKAVLGCDFGTRFEGYSVIVGSENLLNVMWELPDKKKIVRKLEERKNLRRARRFRNCRRRECRSDNRSKDGFIAPSQLVMIQSRIKAMSEFFKCYPVSMVAIEDVCFNHRDKRWGKNFSTIEVGKKYLYDYIRDKVGVDGLIQFSGYDTKEFREKYGLRKSSRKSEKTFFSHCVDSFAIANELSNAVPNTDILFVDDGYRFVRRRLHDSQFSKGNIRHKYSSGSFKEIRKGTICDYGQIVGGTGNSVYYQDFDGKPQKGKSLKKIGWLSHKFKSEKVKT